LWKRIRTSSQYANHRDQLEFSSLRADSEWKDLRFQSNENSHEYDPIEHIHWERWFKESLEMVERIGYLLEISSKDWRAETKPRTFWHRRGDSNARRLGRSTFLKGGRPLAISCQKSLL
jgi:hypothetical protein